MRKISLLRFDALAGYSRVPMSRIFGDELGWFEQGGERVLGILIRDRTDGDYGSLVFGRDARERFRAVSGPDGFHGSRRRAEALLSVAMERVAAQADDAYHQGDERGRAMDFFAPQTSRERLNPSFITLAERETYSPARAIIEPMMHWYEDADGNFVEQFQTTGFDARIWELYLFATFVEMGYSIDRSQAVPDFTCQGIGSEICVEAVTVGPTKDRTGAAVPSPPFDTPEDQHSFMKEYMPIKFAGPLKGKLDKRYWERPNVAGKPLLFAIQDFHAPMSMLRSRSALPIYLYGRDHDWHRDETGRLCIVPRVVSSHSWGNKTIPSGFFDLPGAENVSAVLFSNSGTISKFNRMGMLAGFGSSRVRMVREGFAVNHDPDASEPHTFSRSINESGYSETWAEGTDVYHNPKAKFPLDAAWLPGAAHHRLLPSGNVESQSPDWHPLASITSIWLDKD